MKQFECKDCHTKFLMHILLAPVINSSNNTHLICPTCGSSNIIEDVRLVQQVLIEQ